MTYSLPPEANSRFLRAVQVTSLLGGLLVSTFLRMAVCFIVVALLPHVVLAGDIGVVLMHGKWGTASPKSPVGKLKARLDEEGFIVITPDMPWSRTRYLEKSYENSMAEIDAAIAELKGKGATRIVVAGHSMGANAALGYAARREGLSGVMAIAPGHVPDELADKFASDVAKARSLIAEGKGAEIDTFDDLNQGVSKDIQTSARAYMSWFDPKGPAAMPLTMPGLKAPVLWLVGESDSMYRKGEGYAYSRAPANPKNAYVVIDADHKNTPVKGSKDVIKWLKNL